MNKMWKQAFKAAVVLATSVVAVPYALAIMANVLYGWPQRKDRYKRALHPWKVYALNYAICLELSKIRYMGLAIKWRYFYNTAGEHRLHKDIPFGKNENYLDLYFPKDEEGHAIEGFKPIVVFVYGGSWGAGDKNMYGLLCSQLADHLKAIVCCPNYSIYPKGFVDDMVQDIVDCLTWLYQNADEYGGDREHIVLIGHSAGAHLCMAGVLELVMKRILYNNQSTEADTSGEDSLLAGPHASLSDTFAFEDKHFNGSIDVNNDQADRTNDQLTTDTETGWTDGDKTVGEGTSSVTESFFFVSSDSKECSNQDVAADDVEGMVKMDEVGKSSVEPEETTNSENEQVEAGVPTSVHDETDLSVEDYEKLKEGMLHPKEEDGNMENPLTKSQREAKDLLSSIDLIIGLAGVYHIGDHFEYESSRGIEDISAMCKAMYGPESFDRFSPTCVIENLPSNTRLPPVFLMHGEADQTVPVSSSVNFAHALKVMGDREAILTVIPGCGHHAVCLDLMEPKRLWHDALIGHIQRVFRKYITPDYS